MTPVAMLRARIWIDGELVRDDMISLGTDFLGAEHVQMCADAEHAGKKYLVEISDPDGELDELPLRFGNDTEGMVDPIEIDMATLPDFRNIRRDR